MTSNETARADRQRIYDAIQASDPGTGGPTVVTGWVVIAELSESSGERWLTKLSGDAAGNRLPAWHERAYLTEDWSEVPDPVDDEE